MAAFVLKQNDTSPAMRVELFDSVGKRIDLSGCTVRFLMRAKGATIHKVADTMEFEDAEGGIVIYRWKAADTDTAGNFQAEVEVTYPDNTVETFPRGGYIGVKVLDDIA
jgi:Rib/alpha/Esp surface antigen-like repeat protein